MALDDDVASTLAAALGGRVHTLRRLAGGASRLTWSLDLETHGSPTTALICQLDRAARSPFATGVRVEAALLAAAGAVGVPAPVVVATGAWEGGDRGWLVVERLEGETIPRRVLRDDRWAAARGALTAQCATALARIHEIDPRSIDGLPPADPLRDPTPMLDALGETRPVLELGARWLAAHRVPGACEVTVHGDFRLGNLLVDEDGLRGVLDWELAHAGDPAEDLGWLCARSWRFGGAGHVGGFGDVDALLAAYKDAGGEVVSQDRLRWWEAYAAVKWAVICAIQASAHLSGATRSVELAAIGRRVCEPEWDLLLTLGMAAREDAGEVLEPVRSTSPLPRPTAAELLEAVTEHLDRDDPADGDRGRFEARVARNALQVVARELELGQAVVARHAGRLASLGFAEDAALVAALRSGTLDDELDAVGRRLAGSTRDQLAICNPAYTDW